MGGIAAISDLHLGAPGCYLNVVSVKERLLEALAKLSQNHLELLVLVGDIIDLSVGRAPEPWALGRQFFHELGGYGAPGSRLRIDNIVYVPGNHDHHVWVLLAEYKELLCKLETLVPSDIGTNQAAKMVGTVYPSWTPLHDLFPPELRSTVCFAYPFWCCSHGNTRFVFHHGHYFDKAITPLARVVAEIGGDLSRIEAFNLPYMESLFYLHSWDPLVQRAELSFYSHLTKWKLLKLSRLFTWLTRRLRRKPRLGNCDVSKIDRMMKCIGFRSSQLRENDIWVFGHTHMRDDLRSTKALRLFDLGGWVLNHDPNLGETSAWSEPAIFFYDNGSGPQLVPLSLHEEERQSIKSKMSPVAASGSMIM